MTEKEKMLAGKLYDPADEELCALRLKCNRLCLEYNRLSEEEGERRAAILKELGIQLGEGTFLRGPIYFDYGCFTRIGKNCYANYNLTILDICPVDIGDNVLMGTGVSILTPLHPMLPKQRNFYVNDKGETTDQEYGKPITIESNCWIASNVSILPGVRIGEGSVIGAGSVVTKDIPPHSLAAGNPCRVIREITEKDALPDDLF